MDSYFSHRTAQSRDIGSDILLGDVVSSCAGVTARCHALNIPTSSLRRGDFPPTVKFVGVRTFLHVRIKSLLCLDADAALFQHANSLALFSHPDATSLFANVWKGGYVSREVTRYPMTTSRILTTTATPTATCYISLYFRLHISVLLSAYLQYSNMIIN